MEEVYSDRRKRLVLVNFIIVAIYLAIGLQPAWAEKYDIATELEIPSIGLKSDVTTVHPVDAKLETPNSIVGRYSSHKNKTFLYGHASGVFRDLDKLEIGALIYYDELYYEVVDAIVMERDKIEMGYLLDAAEVDTLVIMTCAGESLGGGEATHRLILTAKVVPS